jgi:regulator of protease activity HflC (stomatin/prohibitin superfamily)
LRKPDLTECIVVLDEDHPPASWTLEPSTEPEPGRRPWPLRHLPRRWARIAAIALSTAMAATSVVLVSGARVARQDAGHVGVVRNGGPLDDRAIRQILMPGQRVTWAGMFSQKAREYPAAKVVLTYTVTSDAERGDRRGIDVVSVPTRDGVLVGLEATVFFKFVGEADLQLLRRFDQTFGMRRFPVLSGGTAKLYPWNGDDGFSAMLDATFRPILDNDLRSQVGEFACAQLVASCSLVRRAVTPRSVKRTANRNIASVEARLATSLEADLTDTLGGDYFRAIHVRISHVTLPGNVQGAVNNVQAQYVAVSGAKAQVQRAGYDAKRNELLASTYNRSPSLARIEEIKAAPKGSTIVLSGGDGGSKAPGINVGGGGG